MTPEGKVTAAIVRQLKKWRSQGHAIWWVKIAGGARQQSGLPDFHVSLGGTSCWIEVKAPGEEPTKLQLKTLEDIRKSGAVAGWTDSVEGFAKILYLNL